MLHFLAQTTQQVILDPNSVQKLLDSGQAFVLALVSLITAAITLAGLIAKWWHDISSRAKLRNDVTGAQTVAGAALRNSEAAQASVTQVAKDQVPASVIAAAIGTQQAPSAAPSSVRPPLTGTGEIQPPLPGARVDAGAGIFTQK